MPLSLPRGLLRTAFSSGVASAYYHVRFVQGTEEIIGTVVEFPTGHNLTPVFNNRSVKVCNLGPTATVSQLKSLKVFI